MLDLIVLLYITGVRETLRDESLSALVVMDNFTWQETVIVQTKCECCLFATQCH